MLGMTSWPWVKFVSVVVRNLENRVRDAVTCIAPHALRHLTPSLVLDGLQRVARRAKSAPGFDDEQVTQVELACTRLLAALIDQRLGARERARRREKLDRHVGQALELLLPVDDLAAIVPDDALRRRVQLGH